MMFLTNGEIWRCEFVPPFSPALARQDGTLALGVCDDNTKTIYLDETLEGNLLNKVIYHECTHAVMYSHNVTMNIEQEEFLADIISTYGQEIIDIANKIQGEG